MTVILEKAKKTFDQKGLPGKKDEEYKYTNITALIDKAFGKDLTPTEGIKVSDISKFLIPNLDCYKIILINGVFDAELSDFSENLNVDEFTQNEVDERAMINDSQNENNSYACLNTIQFKKGIYIKIEKSIQIEKPIFILQLSNTSEKDVISMPRVFIELGEQSKSKFYYYSVTKGDNTVFTNAVLDVKLEKAAHGSLTQIQNESQNSISHVSTSILQERDSVFTSSCITLGGKMVRNNLQIILNDENIESHLYGLYQLSGNQHVDNHTVVDHKKPNSNSNELYKGILNEKSRGVFNGKIYVRPDAQKTNAFQSNKNILLSDDATVNTKPQLEIWADDVKCTHGCTTGQLDDEQIFYLQSRGVSKDLAVKMVLRAFQHDIISKLEDKVVIDFLDGEITKRFGGELQ